MLVLTRKVDEIVFIGGDIQIMVVDIRGDKVKLGIVAPEDQKVLRDDAKERQPKPRRADDA
jgi:carbon storage regulator